MHGGILTILVFLLESWNQESNSKSNECVPFFADSNHNLVKAILLFYLNSGCGHFQQWKEYDLSCNDSPLVVEELLEEIEKETVTDEEMKNTLLKFLEAHSYTNTNAMPYRTRTSNTNRSIVIHPVSVTIHE